MPKINSLEDLTPDQLLARARETEESDALVRTLLNSPDTREDTLRLVKKVDPKRAIPELDTKDAVQAAVQKVREENDVRWNAEQERQIKERIEKQRKDIQTQYQLTDADLLEVEKLMVDPTAPIPNYAAAAKVFKASQKQATPTPAEIGPPIYDAPDKSVWGKGIGNPRELDRIALKEAFSAANEVGFFQKVGNRQ